MSNQEPIMISRNVSKIGGLLDAVDEAAKEFVYESTQNILSELPEEVIYKMFRTWEGNDVMNDIEYRNRDAMHDTIDVQGHMLYCVTMYIIENMFDQPISAA